MLVPASVASANHVNSAPAMTLRDGARSFLRNDLLVALVVALAAAAIRYLFLLHHPDYSGFFVYRGVPISDGSTYTYKAISIANGHGIPPHQQPAVRPFYPIVLACFYSWFGFSLGAVVFLNLLAASFSAALIYLCGARALNRFCGLGAALLFAVDPLQIIETPQAATEPLGLLFFIASVYAMLRACQNQRLVTFGLCGVFIGLSNLTRTLTIFTLPFYLGLILVLTGFRARRFGVAAVRILVTAFACLLVLLPWIIRQERLYHIASISDNVGEALYAATSPIYKRWTPAVRRDADADRIPPTVGDRYRYFMRRAAENVKRNPHFYFANVRRAALQYANIFGPQARKSGGRFAPAYLHAGPIPPVFDIFIFVFITAAWTVRARPLWSRASLSFGLVSIGLAAIYEVIPPSACFLPIAVGIAFVSWRAPPVPNLILVGSLVAAAFGSVLFANPILPRAILMTDWLFSFYYFASIWFPAEYLCARGFGATQNLWARRAGETEEARSSLQEALAQLSRRAMTGSTIVALIFFAASGVRLLALTRSNSPDKSPPPLAQNEKTSILQRLQQPPFSVVPATQVDFPIFSAWGTDIKNARGRYVVEVQVFKYCYYIPPGAPIPAVSPFTDVPYARTVVIVEPFDFTIPGDIPPRFAQQPVIFVGFVPEALAGRGRIQVKGLAVIPCHPNGQPDFAHAICRPEPIAGTAAVATSQP